MASQVCLLQRAAARLGVKASDRREGLSGAGERVLRLLYSTLVTRRGGRGAEIETRGAGSSAGVSGEAVIVIIEIQVYECGKCEGSIRYSRVS